MKRTFSKFVLGAAVICLAGGAYAEGYERNQNTRQTQQTMQNNSEAAPYTAMEPAAGLPTRDAQLTTNEARSLQRELEDRGYNPGPIDGVLGPRTEQALRAFQENNNLYITGTATAETLEELGMETAQAETSQPMLPSRAMDDPPYLGDENPPGTYRTDEVYAPQ